MPEIAFINSAFLAGTALVASPIIVHLINRMRYRRIEWAPLEFLLESQRKNRRRVLLKQLLLLLLRILIVLLFVFLVARPFVGSRLAALFGDERTHDIVVLDDSCSMSDRWGDTDAFAQARRATVQLAKAAAESPGAHSLTVIRLSRPEQIDILRERIDEITMTRLQGRLESMACTHGGYGLLSGVKEAGRLFEEDQGLKRTLHIVSDFRARDWVAEDALVAELSRITAAETDLNLVRCVTRQHQNLSIADVAVKARNVAAQVPVPFDAVVRNQGPGASQAMELSVTVDGKPLPSARLDPIPAGESTIRTFDVTFDQPGQHTLRIRIPQDSLAADDERSLVLDIQESIPIMIVSAERQGRGTDYVSYALAPGGEARTGVDAVLREPGALATERLEKFRMVFLVNVPQLSGKAATALSEYVAKGGALIVFLGDQVQTAFYNAALYREGEGPLPAPLSAPRDIPQSLLAGGGQLDFERHPVFTVFAGERNPFIQAVRVRKVFSVPPEWKPGEGTQVVARLRSGEPYVLEKRFGNGSAMLFMSGVGPEWTNWPKNPSFVITMLQLQSVYSMVGLARTSREVGSVLEVEFESHRYRRDITLVLPGTDSSAVRIAAAPAKEEPAKTRAAYAGTYLAGIYELIMNPLDGPPEKRRYAFNTDSQEGDLRMLTKKRLGSRLKGIDYRFQDVEDLKWYDASSDRHELLNLIVAALVLCLVGEQLLACHLSYHPKPRKG